MKKKICVVTGTRAEYGLMKYLIIKLSKIAKFDLSIAVTGSHLSKNFGNTYNEILKDGLKINKKINISLYNDKKKDIAKSTSIAVSEFSKFFHREKFDLIIITGDRYEILGVVIAAYFLNIRIAHFHGGELTEGLIDEGIRHSITKMSNYHFVSTSKYKKRVMQLGENTKDIYFVGSLSLDSIKYYNLINKKSIEKEIGFKFKTKNILFTYHPLTLENYNSQKQIKIILSALNEFKDIGVIFTKSNADADNKAITKEIDKFYKKNKNRCIVKNSLGSLLYFSTLKHVQCVMGNSSSGIIEVPSFKIPTINIGDRQGGREKSKSIINVKCNKEDIVKALKKISNKNFIKSVKNNLNPYYKKNTVENCIKIIKKINFDRTYKKKFNDLIK